MATDPGAPRPDIDRPDVSPDETPPLPEPGQPGTPDGPDEVPSDLPATDVPDQGPMEMPPTLGEGPVGTRSRAAFDRLRLGGVGGIPGPVPAEFRATSEELAKRRAGRATL